MPSNKDRLYVTLHMRNAPPKLPGLEDTYHWALLVAPKNERQGQSTGRRIHARDDLVVIDNELRSTWRFENKVSSLSTTTNILARILIAKIEDVDRLIAILEETPIRAPQPGWNCIAWLREGLERLVADEKCLGTAVTDWQTIRDKAMEYMTRKKAEHRYDTQGLREGRYDFAKIATWNMLEGRETQI